MFTKKPIIRYQTDTKNCCAAVISAYLEYRDNLRIPVGLLSTLLHTSEEGVSIYSCKQYLQKIGIQVGVYSFESKQALLEIELPVVMLLNTDDEYHYILVYKCTKEGVFFMDPTQQKLQGLSLGKFYSCVCPYFLMIEAIENDSLILTYKNPNPLNSASFIWHKCMGASVISLILGIISYFLTLISASYFSAFFDIVIPNKLTLAIPDFALMYLSILIGISVFAFCNILLVLRLNIKIDLLYYKQLLKKILSADLTFHENISKENCLVILQTIPTLRNKTISIISTIPLDLFVVVSTFFILMRISIYMAVFALVPIILFMLLAVIMQDSIVASTLETYNLNRTFISKAIDTLAGTDIIKQQGAVEHFLSINEQYYLQYLTGQKRFLTLLSAKSILQGLIQNSLGVILIALGTYLIISGRLAEGYLLMFNALASRMLQPFSKITELQSIFAQYRTAKDFIFNSLYQPLHLNDVVYLADAPISKLNYQRPNYLIKIENLTYGYCAENNIFQSFSLEFPVAKTIAVLGDSGCGKTTLMKILSDYISDHNGRILVNAEIAKTAKQNSSQYISYFSSKQHIFSGSLEENIFLSDSPYSGNKNRYSFIIQTLDELRALGILEKDTLLENGSNLSFGEINSLHLLRALATDSTIKIIDELITGFSEDVKNFWLSKLIEAEDYFIIVTHDQEVSEKCQYAIKIDTEGDKR